MTVLARLAIGFSVGGGGTTHAPMITVPMGGRDRRLVLDTGSEVHLLTADLADELELTKVPGEEGTDHSGATMASWSVGKVPLVLGDLDLVLRDVVAIDAPPAFRERGIDGILSPQNLHQNVYAVIDLIGDELLLVDGADEEISGFLRAGWSALQLLQLRREPSFESVVVEAAIDEFEPIPTMLNTGGNATEFSSAAVPGPVATASERLGGGVSGGHYSGAFVGRRTLTVDGRRMTVPALAVRQQMHDPQGLVGMDVLRGTVLACAADSDRPVFWLVPGL